MPGSPTWVSRSSAYPVDLPQCHIQWDYDVQNAIKADYRIESDG